MADRSYFGFTGKRVPRWLAGTTAAAIVMLGMPALTIAPATAANGGFDIQGDFYPTTEPNDWSNVDAIYGSDPVGNAENSVYKGQETDSPLTWAAGPANTDSKNDVGDHWTYTSTDAEGNQWFYFAFDKVSGGGTDFQFLELNKKKNTMSSPPNNGTPAPVPDRQPGDARLTFHDQGGGAVLLDAAELWDGSKWYTPKDTTFPGNFVGEANTKIVTIPGKYSNPVLGPNLPIDTFIEVGFNLTAMHLQPACPAPPFGTANFRNQTGNAQTAALKDYIAGINITVPSTCATLKISKTDESGAPLAGAQFSVSPDPADKTAGTDTHVTVTTDSTGTAYLDTVQPRKDVQYTVAETQAPPGYILLTDNTWTGWIDAAREHVVLPPFSDPLGAITFSKTYENNNGDLTGPGATFSVARDAGTGSGSFTTLSVTDNGANDLDPSLGKIKVGNIPVGSYTISETSAPTGWGKVPGSAHAIIPDTAVSTDPHFKTVSVDGKNVVMWVQPADSGFNDPRLTGGVIIKKTLMDGTTVVTCQQDGTGCGTQFQLLQSSTGAADSFSPYTGTFKVDGTTQSGSSTVNVGTNGTATVTGLPWDFYYAFKEITPPAGYNLPANTLSGTVHITAQVANDQTNKDAALSVLSVGDPQTVVTTKAQGQDGFALNLPTSTKLYDQATISGVTDPVTTDGIPVGTISYYLYKAGAGGTLTCSSATVGTGGLVLAAGPYDVAGSGTVTMPQADGYVPTATGDYYWHAVFTSNYPSLVRSGSEPCGSASEKVTVSKAPTGIGTIATPQSVQLTATGAAISDVVTVTGLTSDATGTINVWLSGIDGICPNPASATPLDSATLGTGPGQLVPLSDGNGAYYVTFTTPPTTVYQAGSYKWLAAYSGDVNNDYVTHTCGAVDETNGLLEVTTVTKASPTISTTAVAVNNDTNLPGVSVTDTATVSGLAVGPNETDLGTVTFRLYGPFTSDTPALDTCSVALYESPQSVPLVLVNGTWQASVSPSVNLTQAGRYRWVASYSGDEDNNAKAGSCIDPNELVTVAKASPTISTSASPDTTIGVDAGATTPISDTAIIAGLTPNAGGSVTFDLYGPVTDPAYLGSSIGDVAIPCVSDKENAFYNLVWSSGPRQLDLTDIANGNATATSGTHDVGLPAGSVKGAYFWVATYSGDANNSLIAGQCPEISERTILTRAGNPDLVKTAVPASGSDVLPGDTIHYVVTLSNTGGLPVTSNLVDTLPAGVTPVVGTFSPSVPTINGSTLTWSNVTVNAGQTVVFAYDVTVNADVAAGTLTNTATWAGQSDQTVHTVAPATPSLDKSSPTEFGSTHNASGNVLPGDTIHYVLTLGNTGGAQVTSDLVDTLPSWVTNPRSFEVTTGSYSPAIPSISGSTLTWANVTLGHDQKLVVEFDVTVAADAPAGDLINRATWAEQTDTTKHVVAPGVPTFDKSSPTELGSTQNPTGVVLPGSTIHYVLTLGNTGGAAVTSDLVDTLPTWVSSPSNFTVTHGFVVPATPALSNGGQTLTWPSVTVPHGDSVVIEFDAVVSADAPAGNLVNSATWDEIVDTTTHVVEPGVPGIDKSSPTEKGSEGNPSGVVLPGDPIDYTVSVTNTGGAAVTSDLVDTLPAGVTVVAGSFNTDPTTINGSVLTWTDVRVNAGQTVSFTFQVTVDANVTPGDLRNDATWAGQSDHTIHVVEPGVPHIDKSSPTEKGSVDNPSGNVDAGGSITYTIKISNTGGAQLTSDLVDTLPAGVVPVDGSFTTAPSSYDGTKLVWKDVTLAPAATFSVTFQVTVATDHSPGELVNKATWSGESDQTVHVVPPGIPGLDKSSPTEQGSVNDPSGNVNPGDTIHYSVLLSNTGGSAITSDLVDTLPAGVTPVAGTFSPSEPTINGSTLTWSNVTVGAQSTVQYTFDVTVDVTAAAGSLVNTATWDEKADTTTHNVVLQPVVAPNPTLVKTADPATGTAVERGGVVTYTVKVGNTGSGPAFGDLVDTLPAGVDAVAGSFTKDGVAIAPDSVTATTITWKNVTVQPGQTITFTYQVTVRSDAVGPNLVNTAKWLGLVSSTSHPLTIPQLPRTGAPFDPVSVALWASLLLALGVMFLVFGRRKDEYEG